MNEVAIYETLLQFCKGLFFFFFILGLDFKKIIVYNRFCKQEIACVLSQRVVKPISALRNCKDQPFSIVLDYLVERRPPAATGGRFLLAKFVVEFAVEAIKIN